MMPIETAFIALLLLACMSPTLTLLRLWQLKEWRFDRLVEHLRREGWIAQLFGAVRPVVAVFWLAAWIFWIAFLGHNSDEDRYWLLAYATLLGSVSTLQLALRKQPLPVWTKKALSVLVLTIIITCVIVVWGTYLRVVDATPRVTIALAAPFLIPGIVLAAWTLLRPLDWYLKQRIMHRASILRESHPHLTVIGITGSVGKTTAKELLTHLLRPYGAVATPLHVNTEMGVAAWITKILKDEPPDCKKILIVEMGAYRTGEIALLASIVRPTIGVMTYVGAQHLALFGSLLAIIQAKGELLRALPRNGHAFLNRDNDAFDTFRAMCACPVTSVGTDLHGDIVGLDVQEEPGGIRFRALDTSFFVPVAGTHLIVNILLAIGVARYLKIPMATITESLRSFRALEHTFELATIDGITVLDDTYNSSPMSMEAAIAWAGRQPHGKKVLLVEGIIELGTQEAEVHRSLASKAANIFQIAFIADPRFLPYFRSGGFGDRAHGIGDATVLKPGDLLVCVGRMPRSTIDRLLPTHYPLITNH